MQKPGITLVALAGSRTATIEAAQELERRGFPHVYCPSLNDGIGLTLAIALRTQRLIVGTGIANIYARHPSEMAAAGAFIHEVSGGRFHLGLGVSHIPTLEQLEVPFGKPVADMRNYVAAMRKSAGDQASPPIVLAALRKQMTRLAGEVAEGALWANAALSHMAESLKEIPAAKRDSFIVGNLAPCAVSDDRAAALGAIRRALRLYMTLPNYQNYFIEAGYREEVERGRAALAAGDKEGVLSAISERMADDTSLFGTANQVREKMEAWRAAGVNWLTLSCYSATGNQPQAVQEVTAIFK